VLRVIIIATSLVSLEGCARADATTPDPTNPVHCIAAFNYGAYLFSQSPREREGMALRLAQAKYEYSKLMAAGRSKAEVSAEGLAFTKASLKDGKSLTKLARACGEVQKSDPIFRQQFSSLLAWGRATEPGYYPARP
jgi:hypothetical protein